MMSKKDWLSLILFLLTLTIISITIFAAVSPDYFLFISGKTKLIIGWVVFIICISVGAFAAIGVLVGVAEFYGYDLKIMRRLLSKHLRKIFRIRVLGISF